LHLRSASLVGFACPSARQESHQEQALPRFHGPCRAPRSDRCCNGGASRCDRRRDRPQGPAPSVSLSCGRTAVHRSRRRCHRLGHAQKMDLKSCTAKSQAAWRRAPEDIAVPMFGTARVATTSSVRGLYVRHAAYRLRTRRGVYRR
jgi:hypothetical protein